MFRHCLLIDGSCIVPVTTVQCVYFIPRFLLASQSVFFFYNSSTVIGNLQTSPCHFQMENNGGVLQPDSGSNSLPGMSLNWDKLTPPTPLTPPCRNPFLIYSGRQPAEWLCGQWASVCDIVKSVPQNEIVRNVYFRGTALSTFGAGTLGKSRGVLVRWGRGNCPVYR